MAYQTSMSPRSNGHAAREPASNPAKAVFGNATQVVRDMTELAELQTKLLAADISALKRKSTLPVILLVIALCVLLGAVPVVLFGVAELLVQQAEFPRVWAYMTSAGGGFLTALILSLVAWLRLRSGFAELENSRRELSQNINWIKTTLKNGGQQPSPPLHK